MNCTELTVEDVIHSLLGALLALQRWLHARHVRRLLLAAQQVAQVGVEDVVQHFRHVGREGLVLGLGAVDRLDHRPERGVGRRLVHLQPASDRGWGVTLGELGTLGSGGRPQVRSRWESVLRSVSHVTRRRHSSAILVGGGGTPPVVGAACSQATHSPVEQASNCRRVDFVHGGHEPLVVAGFDVDGSPRWRRQRGHRRRNAPTHGE